MEGLTLKKLLEDQKLSRGFQEFCQVQHASENLEFWIAVEVFRDTYKEPIPINASPLSPTRKSTRKLFSAISRISSLRNFDEAFRKEKEITSLVSKANQIYQDFLVVNAPKWVCVDQVESDEVKNKIEEGKCDHMVFDELQKQVFVNMEKDLLPRFIRMFELEEPDIRPNVRGSVRYYPDQKLRESVLRSSSMHE